jgi:alginate O-acetyltransferase complex protein AlgI
MSFASLQFIFIFLPLTFLGFLLCNRFGGARTAFSFLGIVSLIFYSMFGWQLLCVLLFSLVLNFTAGNLIASFADRPPLARNVLLGTIVVNLGLLGYLKYVNFFVDMANQVTGGDYGHFNTAIPIGVSFFTFVQIGYLIDAYNGKLIKADFLRYIVFAAFFPTVTAGPLVMQSEMMEQLKRDTIPALDPRRLTIGVTMFAMGLFKKVVLADSIAPFADGVFNGVHAGMNVDAATAWIGAVCYALQLYFDFSGYSDMAIGLATIFAIKLPLNFDSPFKATNISDFWRRWHMTMTRFFTNYLYSGLAMAGMRAGMSRGIGPYISSRRCVAWIRLDFRDLWPRTWHGHCYISVLAGVLWRKTAVARGLVVDNGHSCLRARHVPCRRCSNSRGFASKHVGLRRCASCDRGRID